MNLQPLRNVPRDVALHLRNVRQLPLIVRTPYLRAICRIHQVRLNSQFVTVLRQPTHQHRAHLQRLSNLLRVILIGLKSKHRAPCHHLKIRQL